MTQYSREDALRFLRIHARQLRAWERAGLVVCKEAYEFRDLVQLAKLRELGAKRLSVANIRDSVVAMRSVSGMGDPLLEAGTIRRGSRVIFRHHGATLEPIARQFVFDFEADKERRLAEVVDAATHPTLREARMRALFAEAVHLEEISRMTEATEIYERLLVLDPWHAPSCINLGTIHYNQRQFLRAEQLYRRAAEADPGYALAFFDLGNVLDELQRLPEAVEAYRNAIRLVATYADAHYNLALAYERLGERRKALTHWTAYVKLDPVGAWSNHARAQARKILDREKLAIVHRSGGRTPAPRRGSRRPPLLLAVPTSIKH